MDAKELLDNYAQLLRLSQQMLQLAKQAEWDRLVELEHDRAAIADGLMKNESVAAWHDAAISRKAELIRSILETDNQIQSLTQNWMGELHEILGSIGTEKKLNKAYESS